MSEAVQKHPEADVLVNFASLRSAYDSTLEALNLDKVRASGFSLLQTILRLLNLDLLHTLHPHTLHPLPLHPLPYPQFRSIAIIAEGIPENKTKLLNKKAKEKGVAIIGPATVGGIKPGCFKIGNTGGMTDNIIGCKLYRPGR